MKLFKLSSITGAIAVCLTALGVQALPLNPDGINFLNDDDYTTIIDRGGAIQSLDVGDSLRSIFDIDAIGGNNISHFFICPASVVCVFPEMRARFPPSLRHSEKPSAAHGADSSLR